MRRPQNLLGQIADMAMDGLRGHGASPDGNPEPIRYPTVEEKRSELLDPIERTSVRMQGETLGC